MLLLKVRQIVILTCLLLSVSCSPGPEHAKPYYGDNQAVKEGQQMMQQSLGFLKQLQHGFDTLKDRQTKQAQAVIASQIAIRKQMDQLKDILDSLQARRWAPVELNARLIILKNETVILHNLMQNGQDLLRGDAPAFGVWTAEKEAGRH